MNEFEGILTVIVYGLGRFGVPLLVLYGLARLLRHWQGPDPDEAVETERPQPAP